MAGLTNSIATALATAAAGVANVQAASATPVDAIPAAPFVYIGPPRGTVTPGSWDTRIFHFPMHYLIGRIQSEDRDQVAINDALDLVLAAFRNGITLGLATTGVAPIALIVAFDTDKFYEVGGEQYQSIDFDVAVEVYSGQTYTT